MPSYTRRPARRAAGAILALLFGAGCSPPPQTSPGPPEASSALATDIAYLASDALQGRATGSAGSDSAVVYLIRTYQSIGLEGAFPTAPCESESSCATRYVQAFRPPQSVLAAAGIRLDAVTANVGAMVAGSDSSLRGQLIVIGAHFDHLGRTGYGARDLSPMGHTAAHLGADDNASGTGAVLELARRFARRPARRSVVFLNFASEELGLIGSSTFVLHAPAPLDSIVAMLNLDMVGRLRNDHVLVYGLKTSPEWRHLIAQANAGPRLSTDLYDELGELGTGSDHDLFAAAKIPSVHFTTGLHDAWHTASDRFSRLNIPGEVRVIELVENLVRSIGDSKTVLALGHR